MPIGSCPQEIQIRCFALYQSKAMTGWASTCYDALLQHSSTRAHLPFIICHSWEPRKSLKEHAKRTNGTKGTMRSSSTLNILYALLATFHLSSSTFCPSQFSNRFILSGFAVDLFRIKRHAHRLHPECRE